MTNRIKNFKFFALTAGTAVAALLNPMSSAHAEAFTDIQKTEIENIFKDFLMENPELILEAVDKYRADQEQKNRQGAKENLKQYQDYFADKTIPMFGNPDGDVTVVEFFDYNCGYCRKAFADLVKLVEEDENVRVVLQDMPILSPSSKKMAMISLAAHEQGKYFEIHNKFMDHRGSQSDEAFYKIAGEIEGIDMEKLKSDVGSAAMGATITKFLDRGRALGIRGTPGFVIGNEVFPGYIGMDGLRKAVAKAREENKKTAE